MRVKDGKNKLLVISSGYPNESGDFLAHTFVKGLVDEAKYYYDSIVVLVLMPYKPRMKLIKKLNNYSDENVDVIYEFYPYLPIWPLNLVKGRIAFYFLYKKISKFIDSKTVIHAHFSSPAGVFAYLIKEKVGNEYVLTVHENYNWLIEEIKKRNKLIVKAWRNAKALIRVNRTDIKLLSEFSNNVCSVPNGYNHRKFKIMDKDDCRNNLKIPNNSIVLVNIGFYNQRKNQKLLIDAIDLLPEELKKNLICFIIGGGPLESKLIDYVKMKNLESIILIEGPKNQSELPLYLNSADLFCLSSDSEGNPTVMFEALGVGIPFIGTNVGGVPEIITSDKYGLLCPPNETKSYSNILEKGILKQWKREEILAYSKQFTWKNIFLKTKKYYDNK